MKDDYNFIRVMKSVSNSEAYQAMKLEGNRNLEVKIRFSDFYNCLLTYKPLWKRNIPKGNPSEDYYLKVLVSPNDLLLFNVRSSEAYQVRVRSIDENGIYQDSSGTHAINCSIDLINFVDKSEA